jgi:hypothetical protein
MPDPQGNGGPFAIHLSEAVAEALKEVQRQASEEGRGPEVLAAFRQIILRLRHDPDRFGEPLYRLPVLRMQVRSCVVRPLVIHFAVCEDRPLVFIKGAELLGNDE